MFQVYFPKLPALGKDLLKAGVFDGAKTRQLI